MTLHGIYQGDVMMTLFTIDSLKHLLFYAATALGISLASGGFPTADKSAPPQIAYETHDGLMK